MQWFGPVVVQVVDAHGQHLVRRVAKQLELEPVLGVQVEDLRFGDC